MSVEYTRINWEDSPSTQTPLNAENLNAMDSAIDDLAGAVNDLDGVTDDIDDLESKVGAIKNDLSDGTMTVNNAENAEQLTSTVGIEDNAPYLFRTSGGSNDIGDREDVRKIVGVSVPWNQQIKVPASNLSKTQNGVTITDNRDGSFTVYTDANGATADVYLAMQSVTITEGHKYILLGTPSSGSNNTYYGYVTGGVLGSADTGNGTIYIGNTTQGGTFVPVYVKSGTIITTPVKFVPKWSDLTLMLGTAIADYAYSLQQATAGAGVAWLKKHFPKQFDSGYQAYDTGSLQSVSGLTAHKMVGFNQFDEETYFTEKGFVKQDDGSWYLANLSGMNDVPIWENKVGYSGNMSFTYEYKNINSSGSGGLRVKTIFADRTAYIDYPPVTTTMTKRTVTVNSNGKQVDRMVWDYGSTGQGTYLKDFCVNFSWDGEKDGTYEPYKTWSYALDDSITLRGIPKVDASGNLYYDGDEYLPDGTVNRRYGVVDLGTLDWGYLELSGNSCFVNYDLPNMKYGTVNNYKPNMVVNGFIVCSRDDLTHVIGYDAITNNVVGHLIVSTTKYGTDAAAFKTAMSGVYLVYELATPTTETADPYQATQIVDDWGTEEYVLADGAFPVPVGHNTMYQNNLRAKLEMSPDSPDGDGLYVVQQESGENTYVPLASTATIQDILTRLTALENA